MYRRPLVQEPSCTGGLLYRRPQETSCTGCLLHRRPSVQQAFCTGYLCTGCLLYRRSPVQEPSCTGGFLYRSPPVQEPSCTGALLYRRPPVQEPSCTGGLPPYSTLIRRYFGANSMPSHANMTLIPANLTTRRFHEIPINLKLPVNIKGKLESGSGSNSVPFCGFARCFGLVFLLAGRGEDLVFGKLVCQFPGRCGSNQALGPSPLEPPRPGVGVSRLIVENLCLRGHFCDLNNFIWLMEEMVPGIIAIGTASSWT